MVCHSGGSYGRGGGTSPMNIHEVGGEVMGLLGWASTEDGGGKTSKHCTQQESLYHHSRASQFWALLPWERVWRLLGYHQTKIAGTETMGVCLWYLTLILSTSTQLYQTDYTKGSDASHLDKSLVSFLFSLLCIFQLIVLKKSLVVDFNVSGNTT